MQRNIIILNLILLVIVNLGYNLAEAKEIYVPADYRSIQKAVDAAISGDTVMVAAGAYGESIKLKNGVNLVGAGAPVTIIEGKRGEAVIDAMNARQPSRIEGFTIDAQRCRYGIKSQTPLVIISNIITGAKDYGIRNYGSSVSYLRGNKIFNNKDRGIDTGEADLGTESDPGLNEIYDNGSYNLRVWGDIKAELNWWGHDPPDAGEFSGGTVDYEPWLPTSPLSINDGAYGANDAAVTLSLPAHAWMGEGAQMQFSNDGQTWSDPEPHEKTKSWTLLVGDGRKTVYARVKTAKGEWVTLFDSILLDTIPPTGTIAINGGRDKTTSPLVVLVLTMQDAGSGTGPGAQMQFSNDNKTWSNSEPWASSKIWKLPGESGEYTVYAKFCDAAGNWLEVPTSDTIRLIEPKAGDVYVDDDGSDETGDGSLDNPWRTITFALSQFALSQVDSPRTIYVAPGIYDPILGEKFPLKMKNGVSLVGTTAETTILDAQGTTTVIKCVGIKDATTRIEGFTISNGGGIDPVGASIFETPPAGGIFIFESSLIIEKNIIRNNSASQRASGGIYISDSSPVIVNNEITGNSTSWGAGSVITVVGTGSSPKIISNLILENKSSRGGDIYLSDNASPYIANNIIARSRAIMWAEEQGAIVCVGASPKIINNTIVNNEGNGIYLNRSFNSPVIINNIISNNSYYGICEGNPEANGPGLAVTWNLFHGNEASVYLDEGKDRYYSVPETDRQIPEWNNNLEENPQFVDADNDDYHLLPKSAAIDAGDPYSDYSSEPEPNGYWINIGRYGNTLEATTSPPGHPEIKLSATSYDFGIVQLGNQSDWNLTITNKGTKVWVKITSNDVQFSASPDFLILTPGTNQDVTVTFKPAAQGKHFATLTLTSNDPVNPSIEVTLTGEALPLPLPPVPSAWHMFHHDAQHTGRSPYVGPDEPRLAWVFDTGFSIGSASPIIGLDGTIYLIRSSNQEQMFYAINSDGSLKWAHKMLRGANFNYSSPAIDADGAIYVSSAEGKLYAFNPDGSLKWTYEAEDQVRSSPAIGLDGTIYFSSDNKFYGVNPDGTLNGYYNAGSDSSPAIGSDGTIYVISGGSLYAINPETKPLFSLKWKYKVSADGAPAIGSDDTIYVGCRDGKLYAIGPDGKPKWTYETGDKIISTTPAIGIDGTIFIGSGDGRLYAINPDGGLKWDYETEDVIISSPAIDADGAIYFGSNDGKLYVLDYNGKLKWSYETARPIYSSPAIDADGTIYFGSNDGQLHALNKVDGIPDLTIMPSQITFNPPRTHTGTEIEITAAIQEQSGTTGAHCDVSFYYGDKTHLIGKTSVYVPPGDYGPNHLTRYGYAKVTWDTKGVEAGTYPIIVVISNSNPAESDTKNNEAQRKIIIEPRIQDMIDKAKHGDTVWVAPGIYYENIKLKVGITVKSTEGPEETIIVGSEQKAPVVMADHLNENTAVLDGFTIKGVNIGVNFERGGGVIRNSIITECNVAFDGIGSFGYPDPIIENNIIKNNNFGFDLNNSVAKIINNTIVENKECGIYAWGVYMSPEIRNNIIWGNGDDLRGSARAKYSNIDDGDAGEGNISLNPLFVDAANGDYHLKPNSPCIDAGDANPKYNDVNFPPSMGTERNDMGAYGGPGTPPPPTVPWDVNQDGVVDILDLVLVGKHFGVQVSDEEGSQWRSIGDESAPDQADVNDDGVVDVFDLVLVGKHFGEKTTPQAAPSSIVISEHSAQVKISKIRKLPNGMLKADIEVSSEDNLLYGFQFNLAFDPRKVEVVAVSEGDLLKGNNVQTYWHAPKIDNQLGRIQSAAATRLGTSHGVKGDGVLTSVTFRLKDSQPTSFVSLDLEGVKLVDSKGNIIPAVVSGMKQSLEALVVPKHNSLLPNYPNPFNPETWIPYQLSEDSDVTISIYNITGQLVRRLELGHRSAGVYVSQQRAAHWDGRNEYGEQTASGVYFYSIKAGNFTATRKMILLK